MNHHTSLPRLLALLQLALIACGCAIDPSPVPDGYATSATEGTASGPPVDCSRPIARSDRCSDQLPYFWTCTVGDKNATPSEASGRLYAILGGGQTCDVYDDGTACCTF